MGVDFIRRAGPSFRKTWNRGIEELKRGNLLTQYPEFRTRIVAADIGNSSNLHPGERFIVQLIDNQLLLIEGLRQIGHIPHPPADLVKILNEAGGCAKGTIERVNSLGGVADVAIE